MIGTDRTGFHLMPPEGWLNDPNGLCWFQGYYHVFFQYSPEDANGGLKCWGHYRSRDLIRWEYLGEPILPDTEYDKDGAYSGCAYTGDGLLEIFYTGNVKEEGDFDYIRAGRGANVLYLCSEDGVHFSEKEILLTNADYPEGYTCHIRDPKVWKEGSLYYMVLGARRLDDKGTVLRYVSEDKKIWSFEKEITTEDTFGYMWECPDSFEMPQGNVLACCPQGVDAEENRFQNVYQSGYFRQDGQTFVEWDCGFDFYAPQTFEDEKGRRILIGWGGMADAPYGNTRTVEAGWQHVLTIPRVITEDPAHPGRLLQNPVEELEQLRTRCLNDRIQKLLDGSYQMACTKRRYDSIITFAEPSGEKSIQFGMDLRLQFQDGILSLEYLNQTGDGRDKRSTEIASVSQVRILMDRSILEIYVNGGERVFTTRYYPEQRENIIHITGKTETVEWFEMGSYQYTGMEVEA